MDFVPIMPSPAPALMDNRIFRDRPMKIPSADARDADVRTPDLRPAKNLFPVNFRGLNVQTPTTSRRIRRAVDKTRQRSGTR